ncbi:hypothetical protein AUK40_03830 [Candidatus Wirthbacteria bacterium CG2_30_54_11]|uniref:Abasic site processing protein n=1 Tax=Candidatus Wirthbacteria bacterium CG2_30_54_11 TaxID=1817892 RepID=A0A1J5IY06_9BACT|nr:MAG: hypothetical protein AUK40_03830 [Candidatus Wirthbacteria bacterium CG2_30_54_11]
MCGRFLEFSPIRTLISRFDLDPEGLGELRPRYNIAPSQEVLAVVAGEGKYQLRQFRWGLVPGWARDPKIGYKMINARAETVAEKPAYRSAFVNRRCLIPADGFYEWKRDGTSRTPYFFHLNTSEPFGFGGLYERWVSPEGEVIDSCTIITTTPNSLMAPIHDRMPFIVPRKQETLWLDPEVQNQAALTSLMLPYPAEEMDAYPISPLVNSPTHDSPDNIVQVP